MCHRHAPGMLTRPQAPAASCSHMHARSCCAACCVPPCLPACPGAPQQAPRSCLQGKLYQLRVDELKEICLRLGLVRTGRKADLQGRILSCLPNAAAGTVFHSSETAHRTQQACAIILAVYDACISKSNQRILDYHASKRAAAAAGELRRQQLATGSAAPPGSGTYAAPYGSAAGAAAPPVAWTAHLLPAPWPSGCAPGGCAQP